MGEQGRESIIPKKKPGNSTKNKSKAPSRGSSDKNNGVNTVVSPMNMRP